MNPRRFRFAGSAVVGFFTTLVSLLVSESIVGPYWLIIGGVAIGLLAYLLWPVLDPTERKPSNTAKEEPLGPQIPSSTIFEAVCNPGPYDVPAGSPKKVPLTVHKGDRITGDISEKDNFSFNCYIVDSENYVKFMNSIQSFKRVFKGEGHGAYHVDKTIPSDAQWYAVLDAYGQQYIREITVNLRRPRALATNGS